MKDAGRKSHRVTFQTATVTDDGQGGRSEVYADAFSSWAEVIYLSGNELIAAQQMTAAAQIRIRMAFRATVSVKQRVVWINRGVTHLLQVTSYRPVDRMNMEMDVYCSEEQS